MSEYLDAARKVCGSEKQARVVANLMAQHQLPASVMAAMLLLDDTVYPMTPDTHPLNIVIKERFEM